MTLRNPYFTGTFKYRNSPTEYNGVVYDSKKEAEKAQDLDFLMRAGEILEIKRQPKYILVPEFVKGNKKWRPTFYVADFWIRWKDGREEVIDVKGMKTPMFLLKWKLFEYKYPNLTLTID